MIAQISAICAALSRGRKATPAKVETFTRPLLVICDKCNYAFPGGPGEVCSSCHKGIGLRSTEKGTY